MEHALSLAQSVLSNGVSGQTIIGILSESELAPSRPVDGFDLEEIVQGVAAAMDCLSSWTTALELYQCEESNGIEVDNMSRLGDGLKKLMANDEADPTKPFLASQSPFDHSAKQERPMYITTEVKPSKKSNDEDVVKRKTSRRASYRNSSNEEYVTSPHRTTH